MPLKNNFAPLFALFIAAGSPCGEAHPPGPADGAKEKPVSHSTKKDHKHTNSLAKETSPYLLQHAHNPVNWYPWGTEAFEKAKKEDKPIFLSVGYSSCHWCHVMERESFENEDVAKILNEHFISIKVDREERPDVDEIYMTAVQIVTRHGGWPMSVFMNAEGKPFYGGTYFPADDKLGRMGFKSLLTQVAKVWKDNRKDVLADAERLSEAIREQLSERRVPAERELNRTLLVNSIDELYENFDQDLGGFGKRPKFPPNNGLPLLIYLQNSAPKPDARIAEMTTLTMDKMALGGIHDHLAGGFHRYSTDQQWLLPHFEKMLYDNAMLSRSYAHASMVFNNPEYARVARGVYEWVLRDMTSPEGGFYSTLDADSEGEEGKFYVWDKKQVNELLGADAELFCSIYNIKPAGNFREEATGHDTGLNIPHLSETLAAHAQKLKISEDELRNKLDAMKAKLLAVRNKRIWPALDDKILTAWNGLMISSFARASVWLKEPRYKDAAVRAAEFMLKYQRTKEGRWLATHRKGESKLPAYLDDHAFMAVAFLDLFETTGDARWKKEAIDIVAVMDKHFVDAKNGAYFFTADDHEKLLARTKDPIDKAIPSGNGWATQALVRLGALTGEQHYYDQALKSFQAFQGLMERAPQATESLLLGLGFYLDATTKAAPISTAAPVKDESRIQKGPVIAQLVAGESALRRGAKVPVAVKLTMDKGWHIQAGEKAEGATKVSFISKEIGAFDKVVYPKAEVLKSPELGGEVKVYSGSVVAGGILKVLADAPLGKQVLTLKVHFQACNDKVCIAPEDVTLKLLIDVVEANAEVQKVNEAIVEEIK